MADFHEQDPFDPEEDDFAINPETRCPCLLVLDTSSSMHGEPIAELNNGLKTFKSELMADETAIYSVEVGVLTYGPVELASDFDTADKFDPPTLTARGRTPMGEAIEKAVELVRQRKDTYKQAGVDYYRPWIFLITDGRPTDSIVKATDLVQSGESGKDFMFFAVGVQNADLDVLRKISVREPLRLKELQFRELFQWLSNSLSTISRSAIDDEPPLENPTAPDGWARAG